MKTFEKYTEIERIVTLLSATALISSLVFFILYNNNYLPFDLDFYNSICIILAVLSLSEIIFIYMTNIVNEGKPEIDFDMFGVTLFKFLSLFSAAVALAGSYIILTSIYFILSVLYALIVAISPIIPIVAGIAGSFVALVLINYAIVKISSKK